VSDNKDILKNYPNFEKCYTLESKKTAPVCFETHFRFKSLFNSCTGSWCETRQLALEYGEKHAELINRLLLINKD
jgi:hypothetical protein